MQIIENSTTGNHHKLRLAGLSDGIDFLIEKKAHIKNETSNNPDTATIILL